MKSKLPNHSTKSIKTICFLFITQLAIAQNKADVALTDNYSILKDVSYGQDKEQNMDIYLSREANSRSKNYLENSNLLL